MPFLFTLLTTIASPRWLIELWHFVKFVDEKCLNLKYKVYDTIRILMQYNNNVEAKIGNNWFNIVFNDFVSFISYVKMKICSIHWKNTWVLSIISDYWKLYLLFLLTIQEFLANTFRTISYHFLQCLQEKEWIAFCWLASQYFPNISVPLLIYFDTFKLFYVIVILSLPLEVIFRNRFGDILKHQTLSYNGKMTQFCKPLACHWTIWTELSL